MKARNLNTSTDSVLSWTPTVYNHIERKPVNALSNGHWTNLSFQKHELSGEGYRRKVDLYWKKIKPRLATHIYWCFIAVTLSLFDKLNKRIFKNSFYRSSLTFSQDKTLEFLLYAFYYCHQTHRDNENVFSLKSHPGDQLENITCKSENVSSPKFSRAILHVNRKKSNSSNSFRTMWYKLKIPTADHTKSESRNGMVTSLPV